MLKYEEIDRNNLILATKIQNEIFSGESAYEHYKVTIILNKEYQKYYLVYDDEVIIGITGLYSNEDIKETNSIWLGWFGVRKKYQRKGYGKKILLDTIEIAKKLALKYPIKYFRLYTSETLDSSAQPLYEKVMDIKEYYNNINDINYDNSCLIYTKALTDEKAVKWNNKFLNLKNLKDMQNVKLSEVIDKDVL